MLRAAQAVLLLDRADQVRVGRRPELRLREVAHLQLAHGLGDADDRRLEAGEVGREPPDEAHPLAVLGRRAGRALGLGVLEGQAEDLRAVGRLDPVVQLLGAALARLEFAGGHRVVSFDAGRELLPARPALHTPLGVWPAARSPERWRLSSR